MRLVKEAGVTLSKKELEFYPKYHARVFCRGAMVSFVFRFPWQLRVSVYSVPYQSSDRHCIFW